MAKKNAKIVAQKLGITEQEAEGRIVAELLRNSDQLTADAAGGKHDYEIRSLIGCQNLNCNGYKTDSNYANHDFNSQYLAGNQTAYNAGQSQMGRGQTYNDLVTSNIKKDPVGATLAGAGMIGLGVVTAAGVPALSGMLIGAGVGTGVNAGAQYMFNNGQINPADSIVAGAAGALTFGTSLLPGLLINTGSALMSSAIKVENPNASMAGAAAGSVLGYKVGGSLESALNAKLNPWYRSEWVDMGLGISRYVSPSILPSIIGTGFGTIFSEFASAKVGSALNSPDKEPKK